MDQPEETLEGSVTGEASVRDLAAYAAGRDRGDALAKGAQLGRYVILRRIGAGAMGTVYLGYDPELDRRVALKLLRGGSSAKRREALLREAQAMARLTHPHVVAVHDAGAHDGMVYLAMEYVEGDTLRTWLRDGRHSWREVLDKFLAAGRGLQAAHARGLIHRDFKPDNVMLSREGRVCVMDFGLARPRGGSTSQSSESFDETGSHRVEVSRAAGTPAYMAPEQTLAEPLTPAADQFAFCVSLWEGVHRVRPFEGTTPAALFANAAEGRLRAAPPNVRVPGWLRRTLRRGLEPDPERRWPSMVELLDALERGRGRWRWQLRGGLALAVAVPVALVYVDRERKAAEHRARVEACELEGAQIDAIWNDEARARLRTGLMATGVRFAADSVDTIVPWLDDYREAWRTGRTQACLHGTVDEDWDAQRVDRAMWCFEDRRLQLEATVDQIAEGDRAAARRAVRLASYLDPVETCLDPAWLQHLPAPPSEIRDEIRSIRAELTRSDGLRHAGKPRDALEVAQQARAGAETLAWPPLLASAQFHEGRCMMEAGRLADANATLTKAYFDAQAAGSLEVAFRAARSLVLVHTTLQQYQQAEVWSRHADALARDLTDPGDLDAAEGHFLKLGIHVGQGDYAAAIAEGERAFEMRARVLGAEHPISAAVLRALGTLYLASGRPEEARDHLERAYAVWLDAVGAEHPRVADLALSRGEVELAAGRPEAALPLIEESLAIDRKLLASDHPKVAESLRKLGQVQTALGRLDEAEASHARAVEILRDALGPRHRRVANALLSWAEIDRRRGRFAAALDRCERAREMLEDSLDPKHPDIMRAMETAADVLAAQGDLPRALALRREALARRTAARGAEAPELVVALTRLGDTQRAAGDAAGARQSYQRALAIATKTAGDDDDEPRLVRPLTGLAALDLDDDPASALRQAQRAADIVDTRALGPYVAGRAHFVLARALAATNAPADRIRAAADAAHAALVTMHDDEHLRELETWRATGTGA